MSLNNSNDRKRRTDDSESPQNSKKSNTEPEPKDLHVKNVKDGDSSTTSTIKPKLTAPLMRYGDISRMQTPASSAVNTTAAHSDQNKPRLPVPPVRYGDISRMQSASSAIDTQVRSARNPPTASRELKYILHKYNSDETCEVSSSTSRDETAEEDSAPGKSQPEKEEDTYSSNSSDLEFVE